MYSRDVFSVQNLRDARSVKLRGVDSCQEEKNPLTRIDENAKANTLRNATVNAALRKKKFSASFISIVIRDIFAIF